MGNGRSASIIATISILVLSSVGVASATETIIPIEIQVQPTAREHLAYASRLAAEVPKTPEGPERMQKIGTAIAHYSVVSHHWPDDHHAIAESRLMIAKLSLDNRMPRNAAETLEEMREYVKGSPYESRLHLDLGRALRAMRRDAEAIEAFRTAIAPAAVGNIRSNVELEQIVGRAAVELNDLGRHDDAAASYRRLAQHPSFDAEKKASYALRAAEQAIRNDRASARADLARAEAFLKEGRKLSDGGAQRRLRATEEAVDRFRKMHGL